MNDLLRELIYETILFKEKQFLFENKKNKPPKNIKKGRTYKCIVRQTASKKFKKEIKNNHGNKKIIMVKVIEPDGRGDFSIIKLNKKTYMVKTSSLK
tara:strand:- start:3946 stop:4236 length:291 start_codon:yes stop_codon:yes gene_type:complete